MARKGGLGKGLDSLFQDVRQEKTGVKETLKINSIEPEKGQPRKHFDEKALAELAESIGQHGLLQPIIVRPIGIDGYRIIAGERRWRAAMQAGLKEVPAIVLEASEQMAMEIALVENLQRTDLNSIEEAEGFVRLIDSFGLTQEQAAVRVGKSRPVVANAMRLLSLPPDVVEMLRLSKITTGHGKALLSLDDPDMQVDIARSIVEEDLNVRQTEMLCKKLIKKPGGSQQKLKLRPTIATEVEIALQEVLGTEVKINYKNGKGRIEVNFYSDDQLKSFANRLGEITF